MDDAFKQAMGAYDAGRYAEARQRFQQLVNAYPHHSELWLNLGNVEYRLNELTLAEKYWQRCLAMNPLEANAYLNLGNLCFKQERWRKAVDAWEQFTRLKDAHAGVRLNLGLAYEKLGDMDSAMAAYSRFMASSPMAVEAVRLRQRFEAGQKRRDARLREAEAAMAQGALSQARDSFEQAFTDFPGTAQSYKAYAALLYKLNDSPAARTFYEKSCRLNDQDPVTLVNLGVIYEKSGAVFDACWAYQRALACRCEQPDAVSRRLSALMAAQPDLLSIALDEARRWREKGDGRAAKRRYDQLQQWPDLPEAIAELLQSACEVLAVETDPRMRAAAAAFSLGEEAYDHGRYDQALGHLTRYLELAPHGQRAEQVALKKAEIERQMGAVIQSMLRVESAQREARR
ncbi:MAG: tetratricopeptide repeat protein [Vampirovibrionales bacterium]|nr:tetratricopeptide repeat protein [Vampirovibrionales bacterium]